MPNTHRLLSVAMIVWLHGGLASQALQITRGPYLQLQTASSMHIVWWTDNTCTGQVEWGATAGYGNITAAGPAGTRHEIEVAGLAADSLYHYRVRCDGTPLTGDATFRTAIPDGTSSLSFTFVGDTASSPSNATANYNAMLPETANGFCITLGDLAGRGEDNITDYWQSHFFSPAANFLKHICMYAAIGNHELYDETATYVYPVRYLANFSLPTANSGTEFYYSFDKANLHFTCLDTFWTSYSTGSAQRNWLINDLAATSKTWKIVFGHDGAYISEDGQSNGSLNMRNYLVPLFEQYGVDFYLHGHYHNYERNLINGVVHIDQGTGGSPWSSKTADDSQHYVQAYANQRRCFMRFDIEGSHLLGRCIQTSDGAIIDGFQMDKPPITMPWADTFPAGGPELNWIAPWNYISQCGLVAHAGNPSGDGYVFAVGDTSGYQYAYPMLSNESQTNYSIEADVYYDAATAVKNHVGVGVRGRLFFSLSDRSYYALAFVRNDSLAANGHCVLLRRQNETETVLADWAYPDVSGWHTLKLSATAGELSVWINGALKTASPIADASLPKGRPFIYNYRATSSGAKTRVDDVTIGESAGPPAPDLITDFEGYADGTQVMFRQPSFSGSTSAHLVIPPNTSQVVTESAFGGTKVCQIDWAWLDTTPQRWLRLTTSGLANVGNPTVDLTRPLRFRFRMLTPGSLRLCVGIRETGVDVPIGANGGSTGTIEWVGATAKIDGAPQGRLIGYESGQWQTLTFDLANESVLAFTGDGVLAAANNKGVIEHIALAVVDTAGPLTVQFDVFEQLVGTAPVIAQQPASQSVCPGETVAFTVEAEGGGGLVYQWQKNGSDLVEGDHYSGVATPALTVTDADAGDVAAYQCVVTNAFGHAISMSATLALKAETVVAVHPVPRYVGWGQAVDLSVAASGEGALTYRWQKNAIDLVEGGHYAGVHTPTLMIVDADRADEAEYRCVVTADCGSVPSNAAIVTVGAAGDFDSDHDVDLTDFNTFQFCFNGPNRRLVVPGCIVADFDHDGDVDLVDFSTFGSCFNGPNRAPAVGCP